MNELLSSSESMSLTAASYMAPLWLVFPEDIISTQQIIRIHRCYQDSTQKNCLEFDSVDGNTLTITVKDINETWPILQKLFAEGVPSEP